MPYFRLKLWLRHNFRVSVHESLTVDVKGHYGKARPGDEPVISKITFLGCGGSVLRHEYAKHLVCSTALVRFWAKSITVKVCVYLVKPKSFLGYFKEASVGYFIFLPLTLITNIDEESFCYYVMHIRDAQHLSFGQTNGMFRIFAFSQLFVVLQDLFGIWLLKSFF